jgi:hypothetical protein
VGILFCGDTQSEVKDILVNDGTENQSQMFRDFLNQLRNLESSSAERWMRVREKSQAGHLQIDMGFDSLVFHVGPEIEKQNQGDFWVRRLVGNDPILILWTKNHYDLDPKKIAFQFNIETILISERDDGLVKVNCIWLRQGISPFPTLDGEIMDLQTLITSLPQHLVSASSQISPILFPMLKEEFNAVCPAIKSRRSKIDRIFETFKDDFKPCTLENIHTLFALE